jgi:3-dehydroquinate dehydratase II
MAKVLVIHGLGMNMRGKVQTDVYGKMTLPEYDAAIRDEATGLGLEVEIFHSNIEGEIVNKIYDASESGVAGAVINPAGFTTGYRGLAVAIDQVGYPVVEVHVSNLVRRGLNSDVTKVATATVTGFGIAGYRLALRGLASLIEAK